MSSSSMSLAGSLQGGFFIDRSTWSQQRSILGPGGGSGQAAFDVGLEGRLSAESGRFDAERAALLAAFGAVARATGSGAAG